MGGLNGSIVRRLQLGRALKQLREEAGLSVEVAAPRLDWSSSKLSRIENGQQAVDVHGVKSMLDLYDHADRWHELLDLCRQTRQKGWWRAFGLDDLGYVPLETEARSVRDFTLGVVPGLLQTADYARALFGISLERRTSEQLDNEVEVRMIRQRRLTSVDDPLGLVAVVDEAVLRRAVGGAEVMRAHLRRLADAAALPSVTLQVLLAQIGAYPALSASFTLLHFGGLGVPDIVYVPHPMGAVHIDKESDVARATLAFDRLRSLALGPTESAAFIRGLAEQMWPRNGERRGPDRCSMAQEQLQRQR